MLYVGIAHYQNHNNVCNVLLSVTYRKGVLLVRRE